MIKSKIVTSDCFANQKFLLNCFGLLHSQNVFRKVYTISLLFSITIYLLSLFPEIVDVYYIDLQKFITFVMFEIGLLACLIAMCIAFCNRFELKQLFEKLQQLEELSNFKNGESGNVFLKQFKDIVRKQAFFGISWTISAQIVFISVSVVISLNKEQWILPLGSRSAIIDNDNIQFLLQIIMLGILCTVFILLQIVYINVLTLICGHCKLLHKYIALSFTDYQGDIFEELNLECIEKKIPDWETFQVRLRHIVPYHIGIMDAANQLESVFSLIVFIAFGGESICMCLLVYHSQLNIETLEAVQDANILIVGFSMLIIISIHGEQVATESSKIASICYELDFVGCDLRIQKALIIIMAISQRPITPTIGKLSPLGLRAMLGILQSIYSYYTILRNMTNS